MDLKSSSLDFLNDKAIVVPSAKIEFSSGWTRSTRASLFTFAASFFGAGALFLLLAALVPFAAFSQSAGKLPARVELGAATIEGQASGGSARTQTTFSAKVAGEGEAALPSLTPRETRR
jgi:hypothetical protein